MEDFIIIAVIGMIGAFSLIGMKMFKPDANRKQRKVNAQDSAQKEVIESKDLTITTLKNELRSLNGKLTRFRDNDPELEEESNTPQVTFEEITALVQQTYPQYAKMLPLLKNQIMDATEGMSMEQILSYVKEIKGNKQSQGNTIPTTETYNPNWA